MTFPVGTDPERPGLQPTRAAQMTRSAKYEFIIGDLRNNAAERLRVTIHEFNGHDIIC